MNYTPVPSTAIGQRTAQAAAAQLAQMQQQQQQQQQQSIVPTYTPSSNILYKQAIPKRNTTTTAVTRPLPTSQAVATSTPGMSQQQSALPCTRCGYPNCDVQIVGCNCLLHIRCCPVPLHTCPNPQCFNSDHNINNAHRPHSMQCCQLELLPMEFKELDEARRVSDLAAQASWRAKEKSRARKKAKLDNNGMSVASNENNEGLIMSMDSNVSIFL
jgi:hypothetical protein